MGYDKNGNIQNLSRNGNSESNIYPNPIDELQYFYADNSNRLLKVSDETNNTSGFKDDNDQNSQDLEDDYSYDANGNLISDQNKGINLITYNHLNLPKTISFGSLGSISYIYNALGQKVNKTVLENGVTNATDYLDGYQYLNKYLKYFPTAEGYVNAWQDTGIIQQGSYLFNYVYSYTDHLGNIRLSYVKNPNNNGELKIIEENNYYPFGLKHENYNTEKYDYKKYENGVLYYLAAVEKNDYQYKFNGKEYQDELGLNVTAMDFRQYDSAIGRFNSIDALSEIDPDKSPFAFARNSPMVFNDPSGLCPECEYNDGDDHDWNAGLVLDRSGEAPIYNSDFGSDGNHHMDRILDEVSIKSDTKPFDKNGIIDEDSDGYERNGNEKAVEAMANTYQNIGAYMSIAGTVLALTPLAPLGLTLIAAGTGLSWAGIGIELVEDINDGGEFDYTNHAVNIVTEYVPDWFGNNFSKGSIGIENLYMELGSSGSDAWIDFMSDLHK